MCNKVYNFNHFLSNFYDCMPLHICCSRMGFVASNHHMWHAMPHAFLLVTLRICVHYTMVAITFSGFSTLIVANKIKIKIKNFFYCLKLSTRRTFDCCFFFCLIVSLCVFLFLQTHTTLLFSLFSENIQCADTFIAAYNMATPAVANPHRAPFSYMFIVVVALVCYHCYLWSFYSFPTIEYNFQWWRSQCGTKSQHCVWVTLLGDAIPKLQLCVDILYVCHNQPSTNFFCAFLLLLPYIWTRYLLAGLYYHYLFFFQHFRF